MPGGKVNSRGEEAIRKHGKTHRDGRIQKEISDKQEGNQMKWTGKTKNQKRAGRFAG